MGDEGGGENSQDDISFLRTVRLDDIFLRTVRLDDMSFLRTVRLDDIFLRTVSR